MLSMVGAFAEFERSMIRARQAEGIALAKARGAYMGRPRSVTDEQIAQLKAALAMDVPLSKAARKIGISRTTAYRYLRNPVH
jgi:DNA invertase Pin-like site-specific DNA recombinase